MKDAGFELVHKRVATENMAGVARRKREARAKFQVELVKLEGEAGFAQEQRFYEVAELVARERRLSRFAFAARKTI